MTILQQNVRDMAKWASWANTDHIRATVDMLNRFYRQNPPKSTPHALMRRGILAALGEEIYQREG